MRVVNLANYIGATYQNPKQHFLIISTLPRNWAQITTDVIVPPAAVAALERTRTGAVLGAIVAWALFNGHHISPLGINFDLAVTPGLAVTGIVWALLMGLGGGLMPAFRSARVPVTEALRAI